MFFWDFVQLYERCISDCAQNACKYVAFIRERISVELRTKNQMHYLIAYILDREHTGVQTKMHLNIADIIIAQNHQYIKSLSLFAE